MTGRRPRAGALPPIGRALRAARTLAGVSQAVVSESMGVSKAAVAAWETGNRSVSMLQVAMYAHVCGLSQQQMGALLDVAQALPPVAPSVGDSGPLRLPAQVGTADRAGDGDPVTVDGRPSGAVTAGVVECGSGGECVGVDEVTVWGADEGHGRGHVVTSTDKGTHTPYGCLGRSTARTIEQVRSGA